MPVHPARRRPPSGHDGSPFSWRRAATLLALSCVLSGALTTDPAQAVPLAVGTSLTTVPTTLVDPLGTLVLSPSQFLVPVQAEGADRLSEWQFSLHFNADVAMPADLGGLYLSVYQADFGGGAISQITGSGLLFDGHLDDVSGYFELPVSGEGVVAYVLFEYLSGHDGQDAGVQIDTPAPPTGLPEPSTLGLLTVAVLGAWQTRRRLRAQPPLQHLLESSDA
jgi:hypothetical protein